MPAWCQPTPLIAHRLLQRPCDGRKRRNRPDRHGARYTHIDRLYRRDEPKEALEIGFWEAIETLEENWRMYAASYERSR